MLMLFITLQAKDRGQHVQAERTRYCSEAILLLMESATNRSGGEQNIGLNKGDAFHRKTQKSEPLC